MSGSPEHGDVTSSEPVRRRGFIDRIFAPWMGDASDTTRSQWDNDVHRAYIEQQPLRARSIVYAISIVTICLLIWAAIATVDETTRGEAKVIPSRKIQVIQSQDGGIVTEILVREGDAVEKGQLLLSLDQTRSQSSFRENRSEFEALSVKSDRLKAMVENTPFEPSADLIESVPRIVAQEQALYAAGQQELALETEIAEHQLVQRQEELVEVDARARQMVRALELTEEELAITRPMVASGAVSQVEILRLEREVNQLRGELAQAKAQQKRLQSAVTESERKLEEVQVDFVTEHREELATTLGRMNSLREAGAGLSHRVMQNTIRSPVSGTINRIHFHTIGGVVLPGKDIVEIVPADDTLLLEVKINPKDIAFLVPG